MKKIVLVLLTAAAITTFGFVSYDSNNREMSDEINENIIIKGLEKSGYSESNTASL